MKRSLAMALVLVLCAATVVGGSIAYYTDSASNVNIFTLSEGVIIRMDEAEVKKTGDEYVAVTPENRVEQNTYENVYPGAVMPKDPTVTLEENSDDAFVRVTVTVENGTKWMDTFGGKTPEENFMLLTCNTLGTGWVLTECETVGDSLVYTLLYSQRLQAGQSTTPVFTKVCISENVDATTLPLFAGGFTISVDAQAIQATGFENVQSAFAKADGVDLTPDTSWYNASLNAFTLNTPQQLAGLAQLVNAGNSMEGKMISLSANIDLANAPWTPIGSSAHPFKGSFNGNYFTISNLNVSADSYAGLFGRVFTTGSAYANVENVIVRNAVVNGKHYAAVIAAHVTGGSVKNCTVENATINCIDANGEDGDKAGAIVGFTPSDSSDRRKVVITGNTVKKVAITANRDAGWVVGRAVASYTELSGNTASDCTVTWSNYGTGANLNNAEVGRTN